MDLIRATAFQHSQQLPNHNRLLTNAFQFFHRKPGVAAGFVSGLAASGGLHPFSDLDIGIMCHSTAARDFLWKTHKEWKIAPWIRFQTSQSENSHIASFFSEPCIHIDFQFYTPTDLPSPSHGPYIVAWDHTGHVDRWMEEIRKLEKQSQNWNEVVHEDEQFWFWTHYSAGHAARGEFHDVVSQLEDLREIVQSWQSRLNVMTKAPVSQTQHRADPEFLERMKKTFCAPHAAGVKTAFKNLIKIQLQQRALIDQTVAPQWKVSLPTISKIQTFSQTFQMV